VVRSRGADVFACVLGWIFFRANDAGQAAVMLRAVVTPSEYAHLALPGECYVVVCLVVIAYFAYHDVVAILTAAKARVGDADAFRAASEMTTFGAATIVTVKVLDFLGERLWWAAPTIASLPGSSWHREHYRASRRCHRRRMGGAGSSVLAPRGPAATH